MRIAPRIELNGSVQRELTALARRGRVEARAQQRAKIVLLAAEGWQNKVIAAEVDLDRRQVALWRQRFLEGGVEALMHDAPRPGRTPTVTTAEFESSIVDKTLHDKPIAATHWRTRTLAAQLGVGPTTIRRVWKRNGLKPDRQSSSKLSRDPRFEDKLLDVVGLYLNPTHPSALVLSCECMSPSLGEVFHARCLSVTRIEISVFSRPKKPSQAVLSGEQTLRVFDRISLASAMRDSHPGQR